MFSQKQEQPVGTGVCLRSYLPKTQMNSQSVAFQYLMLGTGRSKSSTTYPQPCALIIDEVCPIIDPLGGLFHVKKESHCSAFDR